MSCDDQQRATNLYFLVDKLKAYEQYKLATMLLTALIRLWFICFERNRHTIRGQMLIISASGNRTKRIQNEQRNAKAELVLLRITLVNRVKALSTWIYTTNQWI